MAEVSRHKRKEKLITLAAAFALAGICLGSIHFYSTFAMLLFMLGVVGGFAMIMISGVHGDLNVAGGVAYAAVFYAVIRLVTRWCKRGRGTKAWER